MINDLSFYKYLYYDTMIFFVYDFFFLVKIIRSHLTLAIIFIMINNYTYVSFLYTTKYIFVCVCVIIYIIFKTLLICVCEIQIGFLKQKLYLKFQKTY